MEGKFGEAEFVAEAETWYKLPFFYYNLVLRSAKRFTSRKIVFFVVCDRCISMVILSSSWVCWQT